MPLFVDLLVFLFVHACQLRSRERNECSGVIRPVGEEEEDGGRRRVTERISIDHICSEEEWSCCANCSGI